MDKNKQFIEEKYLADLNQSKMAAPKRIPEPKAKETPMDTSAQQTIPYKRENEEEYLDNWNQARTNQPQIIPMPDKPNVPFPWGGLFIAFLNDLLDLLELTGVAIPFTKVIDIITGAIRVLGKIATPGKVGWGSLIGTWIIELIPALGVLPTWCIQIIYNWLQEKKLAEQSYKQAVEATRMQIASSSAETEE